MKRLSQHLLSKIGLVILVIGSGPLFLFALLDGIGFPVSSNPIGLGLLFAFTAPIGILCLLIGLLLTIPKDTSDPPSSYRIDPVLAARLEERMSVGADEEHYINSGSVGASAGIFYFILLGIPGAFFRHLPANFIYTNTISHGRRQAWEARRWESFEEFKRLNDRADRFAFLVLAIGIPLVVFLLFL